MPDRATSLVLRKRFSGRMAPARRGHLPLRSGPRRGRAPRAHGETYASLVTPGIGAPFGAQNACRKKHDFYVDGDWLGPATRPLPKPRIVDGPPCSSAWKRIGVGRR